MYCPNCGRENPDGVAFCGGCGMSFGAAAPQPQAQPVNTEPAAPAPAPAAPAPAPVPVAEPVAAVPVAEPVVAAPVAAPAPAPAPQPQPIEPQPQVQEPIPPKQQAQPKQPSEMVPFGQHFKNIIDAMIHPVTGAGEIAGQYDKFINSLLLAIIVVIICGIVNFITAMSTDLISFVTLDWLYPGNIIIDIILDFFFSFIVYIIRTFGFAGLMVLAGLIVREKMSFSRMLAISSLALIPVCLINSFIGDFLSLIPYVRLGSFFYAFTSVFYFVVMYEGFGANTKLQGNKKGFVFMIVFAIVTMIAGYFSYFL